MQPCTLLLGGCTLINFLSIDNSVHIYTKIQKKEKFRFPESKRFMHSKKQNLANFTPYLNETVFEALCEHLQEKIDMPNLLQKTQRKYYVFVNVME